MAGKSRGEEVSLLFFDTFIQGNKKEEISLDLVRFRQPICVTEVRIVPLDEKLETNLPGSVRLGATNPSSFELEVLVNNLSDPKAPTFEQLGVLHYSNENVNLQPSVIVPTDGVIVKGHYSALTFALYGYPQEVAEPTPQPPLSDASKSDVAQWVERLPSPNAQRRTVGDTDVEMSESRQSAEGKDKAVGLGKHEGGTLPTKTPLSPDGTNLGGAEKEQRSEQPIRPRSPTSIVSGDVSSELSEEDSELMDDPYEDSADLWNLTNGSFDPYQWDFSPLATHHNSTLTPFEVAFSMVAERTLLEEGPAAISTDWPPVRGESEMDNEMTQEEWKKDALPESSQKLLGVIERFTSSAHTDSWILAVEELQIYLADALPHLVVENSTKSEGVLKTLMDWAFEGLSIHSAIAQPVAVFKVRHLKMGVTLCATLCGLNESITLKMLGRGVQESLLKLFSAPHMSIKLLIMQALSQTTQFVCGVQWLLGTHPLQTTPPGAGFTGLQTLFMLLETKKDCRTTTALMTLLRKVGLYNTMQRFLSLSMKIGSATKETLNTKTTELKPESPTFTASTCSTQSGKGLLGKGREQLNQPTQDEGAEPVTADVKMEHSESGFESTDSSAVRFITSEPQSPDPEMDTEDKTLIVKSEPITDTAAAELSSNQSSQSQPSAERAGQSCEDEGGHLQPGARKSSAVEGMDVGRGAGEVREGEPMDGVNVGREDGGEEASQEEDGEGDEIQSCNGSIGMYDIECASEEDVKSLRDCLEKFCDALHHPQLVIGNSSRSLPLNLTFDSKEVPESALSELFRMFQSCRVLDAILLLLTSPLTSASDVLFAHLKSFLTLFLESQQGLLLLFHSESTASIIRILQGRETELDNASMDLAQLLTAHLHTLQFLDQLRECKNKGEDFDIGDVLIALHALHIILLLPQGPKAICQVMTQGDSIEPLIKFAGLNSKQPGLPVVSSLQKSQSSVVVDVGGGTSTDGRSLSLPPRARSRSPAPSAVTDTSIPITIGTHRTPPPGSDPYVDACVQFMGDLLLVVVKAPESIETVCRYRGPLLDLVKITSPAAGEDGAAGMEQTTSAAEEARGAMPESLLSLAQWIRPLASLPAATLPSVGDSGESHGDPVISPPLDLECLTPLVQQLKVLGENATGTGGAGSLPGLVTVLRAMQHLAIPPPQPVGKPPPIKYKYALVEFHRGQCLTTLVFILKKLSDKRLYLWQRFAPEKYTERGLFLWVVQMGLTLVRSMLSLLIYARGSEFKDLTALPSLFLTYMVTCSVPPGATYTEDIISVQKVIVKTLLTYTQLPLNDPFREDGSKDSPSSPSDRTPSFIWTGMLKDVLNFTLTSPHAFLAGTLLLSELLPLPLPLQTRDTLSPEDTDKVVTSRRLWAEHLLTVKQQLKEVFGALQCSSCVHLQHIVRRLLWQVSDLHPSLALLVMEGVLEGISESSDSDRTLTSGVNQPSASADNLADETMVPHLTASSGEGSTLSPAPRMSSSGSNQKGSRGSAGRAVGGGVTKEELGRIESSVVTTNLLTMLVVGANQPPTKAALLSLLSNEDKYGPVLSSVLCILNTASEKLLHVQAQENAVNIIQALCDPDVNMASGPTDSPASPTEELPPESQDGKPFDTAKTSSGESMTIVGESALTEGKGEGAAVLPEITAQIVGFNESCRGSLPSPMLLSHLCSALVKHLGHPDHHGLGSVLLALRALAGFTEQDGTLDALKRCLLSDRTSLFQLFSRLNNTFSKDNLECVSTLTAALDMLRLLHSPPLPQDEGDGDFSRSAQGVSDYQLGQIVSWSNQPHPLDDLSDLIEDSDEGIVGSMKTLIDILKQIDENAAICEPDLTGPVTAEGYRCSLASLWADRLLIEPPGEGEGERLTPSYWLSNLVEESVDESNELVMTDMVHLMQQYLSMDSAALTEELGKGADASAEGDVHVKTHKRVRKKDSLIMNRARHAYVAPLRGGRYGRGTGVVRGNHWAGPGNNFRSRAPNSSRPPSTHVDAFMGKGGGGVKQGDTRGEPPRFREGNSGGRGGRHDRGPTGAGPGMAGRRQNQGQQQGPPMGPRRPGFDQDRYQGGRNGARGGFNNRGGRGSFYPGGPRNYNQHHHRQGGGDMGDPDRPMGGPQHSGPPSGKGGGNRSPPGGMRRGAYIPYHNRSMSLRGTSSGGYKGNYMNKRQFTPSGGFYGGPRSGPPDERPPIHQQRSSDRIRHFSGHRGAQGGGGNRYGPDGPPMGGRGRGGPQDRDSRMMPPPPHRSGGGGGRPGRSYDRPKQHYRSYTK